MPRGELTLIPAKSAASGFVQLPKPLVKIALTVAGLFFSNEIVFY
jgi:hypothetical protein